MEIETLRRASVAYLREKHRELFGEEARSRHREQLFRQIAWRLQALSEGDLSERARKRAHEIVRDADLRTVAPPDFLAFESGRVQTVARQILQTGPPLAITGHCAPPSVSRTIS
jgi:hypothetical protein